MESHSLTNVLNLFLNAHPRSTTIFPANVAIFPNGNRRYGNEKNLSRKDAIEVGVAKLFEIVTVLKILNAKNIFILLCNEENFGRTEAEINELLNIIVDGLSEKSDYFADINSYLHFIGNLSVFTETQQQKLTSLQQTLNQGAPLNIYLGINYSAQRDFEQSGGKLSNLQYPHEVDLAIHTGYSTTLPSLASLSISPRATLSLPKCLWPNYTVHCLLHDIKLWLENQKIASEDVF